MDDQEIIYYIKNSQECQLSCYDSYIPLDLKHYLTLQIEWLSKRQYYLGIKLKRQPTELELVDDIENSNHSKEFRIFYCLKYPEMVNRLIK
jgi:hypothetical protein